MNRELYRRIGEDVLKTHLNDLHESMSASTKRGLQLAVERGRVVSFVPLGYHMTWGERGRDVQIDPMRGPLVRRAFELIAKGVKTRDVLSALQTEGLLGRHGRPI